MKPAEASNTAKVIAASTILLASDPRTAALVAPGAAPLCRQLLSGSRTDRWLAGSAAHPLTRALWRGLERLTLPGIMAHYWHRKRWIESRCRDAIGEGFGRLVILGAGFDTLGLRLATGMQDIEVIEVDHPATQSAKRRALAGHPEAQSDNLQFVACDFGAQVMPATLGNGAKDTIVIIEGVLMYLSPDAITRLFAALRKISAGRLRIVFSFMSRWPDGRSGFRPHSVLIERWLAWRKEPFTWALAPDAIADFLAAHGFRLVELALTKQFSASSGTKSSMLAGENLVVCEPAPVRAANSGQRFVVLRD